MLPQSFTDTTKTSSLVRSKVSRASLTSPPLVVVSVVDRYRCAKWLKSRRLVVIAEDRRTRESSGRATDELGSFRGVCIRATSPPTSAEMLAPFGMIRQVQTPHTLLRERDLAHSYEGFSSPGRLTPMWAVELFAGPTARSAPTVVPTTTSPLGPFVRSARSHRPLQRAHFSTAGTSRRGSGSWSSISYSLLIPSWLKTS